MTCRTEVLAAFRRLETRHGRTDFDLHEVVADLQAASTYKESTIRTHLTSRMCADAADHHAIVYDDLRRAGPGRYRRA